MHTACMQAEVAMHNTYTHIYLKKLAIRSYIEYISEYSYVCIFAYYISIK